MVFDFDIVGLLVVLQQIDLLLAIVECEAFQSCVEENAIDHVILVFAVIGHHHFADQLRLYRNTLLFFGQPGIHFVELVYGLQKGISSNYFDCWIYSEVKAAL